MNKLNKNFRIFSMRQSLIGDSLMALPLLTLLEKLYPGSFKIWHIAKKCSQAIPIYYNYPLIDKILVSDCNEGFGPNDIEEMKKCDLVINTMPPYHTSHDWPNNFTIFEETAFMAGFTMEQYNFLTEDEKRPKLVKWFNVEKQAPKTIALWPCAGYGKENTRNPSKEWYDKLISQLHREGYNIIVFGHPKDYSFHNFIFLGSEISFKIENHLPFFDQIKMTLGCDLVISTDSGSGLIFGAYEMLQITLLTNHFPGHTKNLFAFAPNNINNHNMFGLGNPDKIQIDAVIKKVKELIP